MKLCFSLLVVCACAFSQTATISGGRVIPGGVNVAVTETGSGNNYVCAMPAGNALTSYGTGVMYSCVVTHTNTGTATLAIDGLPAKTINGSNAGSIVSGKTLVATYNGTTFDMVGSTAGSASSSGSAGADPALAGFMNVLNNSVNSPVNVVVLGDSLSRCWQGNGTTGNCTNTGPVNKASLYPELLRSYLSAKYGAHSSGLIPIDAGGFPDAKEWTLTGTTGKDSSAGPIIGTSGTLYYLAHNSIATLAPRLASSFRIYYATGGSTDVSMIPYIDGVPTPTIPISPTTGATQAHYVDVPVPSGLGTHTLAIHAGTDGSNSLYIFGAEAITAPNGVSVHNESFLGIPSDGFAHDDAAPYKDNAFFDVIPGGVQLLVISLGTNDVNLGVTPSQLSTNVQAIINHYKTAFPNITIALTTGPWVTFATDQTPYHSALQTLATTNNAAFYDPATGVFQSFANEQAKGWINPDGIHLSDSGQQTWASYLLPGMFGSSGSITNYFPSASAAAATAGSSYQTNVSAAHPMYLYSHFRDDDNCLYNSVSWDGMHFSDLTPQGTDRTNCHRDMSVIQIGNTFHYVASEVGGVAYWSSSDLVNYTPWQLKGFPGHSTTSGYWAPSFYKEGSNYYVVAAEMVAGLNFKFTMASFDPATGNLSNPVDITPGGMVTTNIFDPEIIKIGSTYYLIYCSDPVADPNGDQFAQYATSSSLTGPYTEHVGADPFGLGHRTEAPTPFQLANGCWRIIADTFDRPGLAAAASVPYARKYRPMFIDSCNAFVTNTPAAYIDISGAEQGGIATITDPAIAATVLASGLTASKTNLPSKLGINVAVPYFALEVGSKAVVGDIQYNEPAALSFNSGDGFYTHNSTLFGCVGSGRYCPMPPSTSGNLAYFTNQAAGTNNGGNFQVLNEAANAPATLGFFDGVTQAGTTPINAAGTGGWLVGLNVPGMQDPGSWGVYDQKDSRSLFEVSRNFAIKVHRNNLDITGDDGAGHFDPAGAQALFFTGDQNTAYFGLGNSTSGQPNVFFLNGAKAAGSLGSILTVNLQTGAPDLGIFTSHHGLRDQTFGAGENSLLTLENTNNAFAGAAALQFHTSYGYIYLGMTGPSNSLANNLYTYDQAGGLYPFRYNSPTKEWTFESLVVIQPKNTDPGCTQDGKIWMDNSDSANTHMRACMRRGGGLGWQQIN